MQTMNSLQTLLTELGPADESVDAVVQLDAHSWAVTFDDGSSVWLKVPAGRDVLVLSGAVGDVPDPGRAMVHETLLNFNALWEQTGGVCMAVADGAVLQRFELPLAELDVDRLRQVLANFAEKLRLWRHVLDNTSAGAMPSTTSLLPMGLRV